MTAETAVWVFGTGMVLFLLLFVSVTAYFLREWKKLDTILETFLNGKFDDADGRELCETRESRVISQLMRILNDARFREKRAVEEKDQVTELISDLSHQLKTPLANIVMNMELLQNDALTGAQRKEFLAHTENQARKMKWLMNSLLKASRLENGMIHFQAKQTGIKETIAKAVSDVYAQASGKQIVLETEEFQDFNLFHNPKWTAEAMANILENAVKYSPKGGRIRIALSKMDLYTRITVSDEGVGIPEKEYSLIFQRFYRGKDVEQQEGNGLGLYLAQLILQQEKGYITVSSRPGEGSSFHIFLLNENVSA
ncbi:MAG: HAMP domain-containing histidine kinase [Lachnospiraceae bacterium]|jgi:signal transduction histidine kinase|nr:HAMP domain-containing histidine kinase [Lachnospiraceae bacterium]